MPILLSQKLPAAKPLKEKGVFVMGLDRGSSQEIRPLQIGIVNLMPKKEETEIQLLRAIGNGPLQIEPTFIALDSYTPKNTIPSHLENFYKKFSEIKHKSFDGVIVTGAPIEPLEYRKVVYWQEIQTIFNWAETHSTSNLFICWGAQAALKHYYGIEKHITKNKTFGVFPHTHLHNSTLLRGLDDTFSIPISRHTEIQKEDILKNHIEILAESKETGVAIAANKSRSQVFSFGHLEYDRHTLAQEYFRDKEKGEIITIPKNYFHNNNDQSLPILSWRANAERFFQNWINMIYQKTPYILPS